MGRDQAGLQGERPVLNTTIMLFLVQDGVTNGAIYALLGLALVLVFAVTRVILIPQGEFVTYGALTYASLSSGQMPGTARLAVAMGVVAFGLDLFAARRSLHPRLVGRAFAVNILLPAVIFALTAWLAGRHSAIAVNICVTDASGLVTRRTTSIVSARTISAANTATTIMVCITTASMASSCAVGIPT